MEGNLKLMNNFNYIFSNIQNLYLHTKKTVSLIYGQRNDLFELKKVLLIQKNVLWSKEIDLFTLKNFFLNLQNFLQFKEIKQFLWFKGKLLWYTVKENISLNWRKFCRFKQIFFNVNKSISQDQRKFFWINKTFFNSKKSFLWPYIKEMFLSFKETVFLGALINFYRTMCNIYIILYNILYISMSQGKKLPIYWIVHGEK